MGQKISHHKTAWVIFCVFLFGISGYMIYKDFKNPPRYLNQKEKRVLDVISCEKSKEFLEFMGYKNKENCNNLMSHLLSQTIDTCENLIGNRNLLTEAQRKEILLECIYHHLSYSVGTEISIAAIEFNKK